MTRSHLVYDRNMKIISFNIAGRANFGKNYQERLEKIVALLDKEQADIVCMQEVSFGPDMSVAERINQLMQTPYKYTVAQMSERYTLDKFSDGFMKKWKAGLIEHYDDYTSDGLAILSREPVTKSRTIVLKPVPADERGRPDFRVRIAQILEFDSGFTITNTHLASNNNSHLQLKELIDFSTTDAIVGDFNMFADSMHSHKDIWQDSYAQSFDFEQYISFPDEQVTLDHMLLKPKFKFTSIRTVEGLSDHSAVIFEIQEK